MYLLSERRRCSPQWIPKSRKIKGRLGQWIYHFLKRCSSHRITFSLSYTNRGYQHWFECNGSETANYDETRQIGLVEENGFLWPTKDWNILTWNICSSVSEATSPPWHQSLKLQLTYLVKQNEMLRFVTILCFIRPFLTVISELYWETKTFIWNGKWICLETMKDNHFKYFLCAWTY